MIVLPKKIGASGDGEVVTARSSSCVGSLFCSVLHAPDEYLLIKNVDTS